MDLLCPGQDSAVGRRDPVTDGCEPDSSVGGRDPVVCGRDPSLGGWELLLVGHDPETVDTRDPVLLPLLVTTSLKLVLLFVLPVLLDLANDICRLHTIGYRGH